MATKLEELEAEALKLDSQARAALVARLLESLEALPDPEAERLWTQEAERRHRELQEGAPAASADEVLPEGTKRDLVRSVFFHRLAAQELFEAARFYEGQSEGLGDSFLDDAERALNQIAARPESAQQVTEVVRRKLFRRFPYSFLYAVEETRIFLLAVMNHRRRPLYWEGRTWTRDELHDRR